MIIEHVVYKCKDEYSGIRAVQPEKRLLGKALAPTLCRFYSIRGQRQRPAGNDGALN